MAFRSLRHILAALLVLLCLATGAIAAVQVRVTPAASSGEIGSTLTVTVEADSVTDLGGFQFGFVYSTADLQAVSATVNPAFDNVVAQDLGAATGSGMIAATVFNNPAVSGAPVTLASMDFKILTPLFGTIGVANVVLGQVGGLEIASSPVGKATPIITTLPSATGITFNQALSASTLTGGAGSVPGSFAFTTPATIPAAVGTYSAAVTFTPTDAINYNSVSGSVTVAVAKATPGITTAPTATGIIFTQALSASTLSGGAGSIPGSFAFTTPTAIPAAVGNYSAAVTFTPTDAVNYTSVSGTVSVAVSPVAIRGVCGDSYGKFFTSAPTGSLCNPGTPTTVAGTGPWGWKCNGSDGGANASCSANLLNPIPVATIGQPSGDFSIFKDGAAFNISRSEAGKAFVPVATSVTSTSFIDTTALKLNTIYQYAVSSDADPNPTVFMTIHTGLYNGWNIVAVPYNTSGAALASFFTNAVGTIFEWVPSGATAENSTNQLGSYETVSSFIPGKGYFAKTTNSTTLLTFSGASGPTSATVTLQPGWTMIANPNTANKTNIATSWLIDGSTLANAISSSKIAGGIYWWNGSAYDSWSIIGDNPQVEPWKGYWLLNLDSVSHTLTIQ